MANDGDFNKRLQNIIGHELSPVSAIQESILTVLGLLHGMDNAHGLCFAIGGRSAHYGIVDRGRLLYEKLGEIPDGILSLAKKSGHDPDKVAPILAKYMPVGDPRFQVKNGIFYAGSGAWRDVGREMFERKFGIPIARNADHGYIFEKSSKLNAIFEEMMHPTAAGNKQMERIAAGAKVLFGDDGLGDWKEHREERQEYRPIATAALAYAFEVSQANRLVFFKQGIREGAMAQCGLMTAGLA
jgi:exopolyphosphatase/pppGpp-phosphohydrolase